MLGDRRAFDARSARPAPPGRNLPSVQASLPQPSIPSLSSKSKKLPKSPRSSTSTACTQQELPYILGAEFDAFNCRLESRKLHLEVVPALRPTQGVVERLVEASADAPCDCIVVSVAKSPDFAEWMRRLLYAGFTVASKRGVSAPRSPGTVACVLDLSDRSSQSATSDDSSVLTDDDSDASDSDDDDWLEDED